MKNLRKLQDPELLNNKRVPVQEIPIEEAKSKFGFTDEEINNLIRLEQDRYAPGKNNEPKILQVEEMDLDDEEPEEASEPWEDDIDDEKLDQNDIDDGFEESDISPEIQDEMLDEDVEHFGEVSGDTDTYVSSEHRNIKDAMKSPKHKLKSKNAVAMEEVFDLLQMEKVTDIVVINLEGKTDMASHMIIATGKSSRLLRAVADRIVRKYRERIQKAGIQPGVEGRDNEDWMIVDLGNVIVQLMSPDARVNYDLERLWSLKYDGTDFHYTKEDLEIMQEEALDDYNEHKNK